MAEEVKKLVLTDTKGASSHRAWCFMDDAALQQTLDLAKTYMQLADSSALEVLSGMTLGRYPGRQLLHRGHGRRAQLLSPEKTEVSVQLKWLPQAQFMGYYVAKEKGFYDEVGLDVTIVSWRRRHWRNHCCVYTEQVDFGVTWVSNLIAANAGGMELDPSRPGLPALRPGPWYISWLNKPEE
jgi:NitT/TauT family transport system substrate-binding protein